jgi:hypothetical protein
MGGKKRKVVNNDVRNPPLSAVDENRRLRKRTACSENPATWVEYVALSSADEQTQYYQQCLRSVNGLEEEYVQIIVSYALAPMEVGALFDYQNFEGHWSVSVLTKVQGSTLAVRSFGWKTELTFQMDDRKDFFAPVFSRSIPSPPEAHGELIETMEGTLKLIKSTYLNLEEILKLGLTEKQVDFVLLRYGMKFSAMAQAINCLIHWKVNGEKGLHPDLQNLLQQSCQVDARSKETIPRSNSSMVIYSRKFADDFNI